MEVENIPIAEIIPYEKNPRKNEKAIDVVARSIEEFGFKVPIVIDKNNVIITGHTRLKAAEKLGMKEVPVIWAEDLDEKQIKAFRIMDNKSHEYASWDEDLLREELTELKDWDVDLDTTGFEDRDLLYLFGPEKDNEFDVEDELNEAEKGDLITKTGDLWQLGEHKMVVGNATDKEAWKSLLGDERFDFMFTDPPYKLAYTKNRFKGHMKTKQGFGFRGQRHYKGVERAGGVPEFDEWLSIANEFQNEKGSNIMIFENWKNTPELWGAVEKYWKVKNMVIWWLPNRSQGFGRKYFLFNKYDIAILGEQGNKPVNEDYEEKYSKFLNEKGEKLVNSYELALFAQNGDSSFNRKRKTATAYVTDHISWSADTEAASGQNLVFGTKPLPILIPYLKVLSNPGEIVVEPFGGSGSTLMASEIIGRKCRLIEIEPLYAQVIIKRWEKLTGQKAKKIN